MLRQEDPGKKLLIAAFLISLIGMDIFMELEQTTKFIGRLSFVEFIVENIVEFVNATMKSTMNPTNNDKEF